MRKKNRTSVGEGMKFPKCIKASIPHSDVECQNGEGGGDEHDADVSLPGSSGSTGANGVFENEEEADR
jgi:hypothetical protein